MTRYRVCPCSRAEGRKVKEAGRRKYGRKEGDGRKGRRRTVKEARRVGDGRKKVGSVEGQGRAA
jgi:hypothetical protein